MRVLVIGSETPVGRELQDILRRRGHEVEVLSAADCRWKSERRAKKSVVRADCEFVVDTRIQSAVDGGVQVHDLDVTRTLWLAKSCQKNKMVYLSLSSSRLFSGATDRSYREDDLPDNSESLAQLLRSAEELAGENCERHIILRLGPVFSHRSINVVTHMLGQLMEGGPLVVGSHLWGCPVAAEDAARVVSGILDQLNTGATPWGRYHYSSSDATNCFEFAEVLLASASQYSEFSQNAVDLVPNEQDHPKLSRVMDCSKLRNTFAIKQSPWRGFIADTVKQYFLSLK